MVSAASPLATGPESGEFGVSAVMLCRLDPWTRVPCKEPGSGISFQIDLREGVLRWEWKGEENGLFPCVQSRKMRRGGGREGERRRITLYHWSGTSKYKDISERVGGVYRMLGAQAAFETSCQTTFCSWDRKKNSAAGRIRKVFLNLANDARFPQDLSINFRNRIVV